VAVYGKPIGTTVRAVTFLLDGEPSGMVGLSRDRNALKFFSDYTDEMEHNLGRMAALRAIRTVMKWVESATVDVWSAAGHDEGHRLLKRLGFTQVKGDYYKWHGLY